VIGHTDNVGNASFNFDLSQRRPIASNLNEAGRAQNRRVEIVITPN